MLTIVLNSVSYKLAATVIMQIPVSLTFIQGPVILPYIPTLMIYHRYWHVWYVWHWE